MTVSNKIRKLLESLPDIKPKKASDLLEIQYNDSFRQIFYYVKKAKKPIAQEEKLISINGFSKEEFNKLFPDIQDFYNSLYWAKVRMRILKRDSFTCQICDECPSKIVHHLNSPKYFPEISLDPENLMIICEDCHNKYH